MQGTASPWSPTTVNKYRQIDGAFSHVIRLSILHVTVQRHLEYSWCSHPLLHPNVCKTSSPVRVALHCNVVSTCKGHKFFKHLNWLCKKSTLLLRSSQTSILSRMRGNTDDEDSPETPLLGDNDAVVTIINSDNESPINRSARRSKSTTDRIRNRNPSLLGARRTPSNLFKSSNDTDTQNEVGKRSLQYISYVYPLKRHHCLPPSA